MPFILTVAPSGSTKLDTRFETPAPFSTHSIVTGKVADDDAVDIAVRNAGATARYKSQRRHPRDEPHAAPAA